MKKNGIMEYWNAGILAEIKAHVRVTICGVPLFRRFSIPLFQHSSIPIFQHSIWFPC
jgi:hypothetical protein